MTPGKTTQADDDPYPRLPPTDPTVKELFAKSGNQCAFPGCLIPVVDELGTVVGQIVHIKGVKPASARFDVTQDPNDRRHVSNLLIMCNPHHRATDDETRYSVARMREIKETHERRFAGVISGLRGTLEDQTRHAVVHPPKSMARYRGVSGLTDDEASEMRPVFEALLAKLARLPPDARSVLATILDRGGESGFASWSMEGSVELPMSELRAVLGVSETELRDELLILKNHGFADIDIEGTEASFGAPVVVATPPSLENGELVLTDLRAVAAESGTSLTRAIVGLDFRLLDGD